MQRKPPGLFRGAGILGGGALAAHAPQLVLAPVIARSFTPAAFGLFGAFVAWHSLASVIATLRLENAVTVPDEVELAADVVRTGLITSLVVGLISSALMLGVGGVDLATAAALFVAVISYAASQLLSYWHQRHFRFVRVAVSRALRGIFTPLLWLVLAQWQPGEVALILGFAAAQALSLLPLADRTLLTRRTWSETLGPTLRRFHRFATLSLPADLLNALTQQAPMIVLTRFFGESVAGHYVFAQRYFSAPIGVAGSAIADSFKQHAAAEMRSTGEPRETWRRMTRVLGLTSITGLTIAAVASPWVFATLFGPEWQTAGVFASILAPLAFAALFVSPFSRILYLRERQDLDFGWQLGLGMTSSLALLIGALFQTPFAALACFSATYVVAYLWYWRIVRRVAFQKPSTA